MSNENHPPPIGDPQPVTPTEKRQWLKGAGPLLAVTAGSFVTLAIFLTPTRLSGASRSARLRWQQRQQEIQQTINAANTNTPEAATDQQSTSCSATHEPDGK